MTREAYGKLEFKLRDPASSPVLVIDLDCTLIMNDSMEQIANKLGFTFDELAHLSLSRGVPKQLVKKYLYALHPLDVQDFQIDRNLVRVLRRLKSAGRVLGLATGSPKELADKIAADLDLFDFVYTSTDTVNLTGPTKAALLASRLGRGMFDYMADSVSDLPVWREANFGYHIVREKNQAIFDLTPRVSRFFLSSAMQ